MLFSQLEEICQGKILHQSENSELTALCIDSRNLTIQKGSVFFAINGENQDGHKYLEEAFSKGIRLFVVEKEVKDFEDGSIIQVDSAKRALQQLVTHHRQNFYYPVIGITGSNGKTIVKEWLSSLVAKKYDVVKSPKSYNSQVGVPLSVWQMNDHHNLGIFEAGISQIGEMKALKEIIKPDIGIFTNIGEAHNEGFSSKKEKAEEKALLFQNCEKIIYRKGNPYIENAIQKHRMASSKIYRWEIEDLEHGKFNVMVNEDSFELKIKFKAPYVIENAIHCAVALKILGFTVAEIQSGLQKLSGIKMRLELKQARGQSYLIDDTYNNDLHGLEIALDFLSRQNQKPNKSVILSDISQSGMDSKELYEKVNGLLEKHHVTKFTGIGEKLSENKSSIKVNSSFYDSTEAFLKLNSRLNDEVVLIKGARNFAFERIVDQLELLTHRTILEINLENIIHNLNFYKSKLSQDTKMMVMVKAYAYGGGIFEIANLLQYHNIDYLGVAYIDEAVELRKHGIFMPIMIMNPSPDAFRLLKEFNLEPEIYSLDNLYEFITYFEDEEDSPPIHLKLETGMNRLGFMQEDIPQLIQLLTKNKSVKVKTIFSHMAGSENPEHHQYSIKQGDTFKGLSEQIMKALWYKPKRHILNSGGISRYPEYHFDMVRLGIGMYGYDPTEMEQEHLKAVSTLKSSISQIKGIKKGETVGYGRSGVAKEDMKIAIVPIGYADGYLRAFGNGTGQMMVNETLTPTFGNICMDMTMLDISKTDARIGDEVIIFGAEPTVKDLANQIGTIPYEIMTNISQRVKRVFHTE
jgi:alanine racemase